MKLVDKIAYLVEAVKFTAEDVVYSVKNKVLDVVDFVKYDVLKRYPTFTDDFIEEKPKAKKKKSKKKKK